MTERISLGPYTQGDDQTINLEFTKDDGTAHDITNWTVFVTVKENIDDSDEQAVYSTDITSHDAPQDGQTSFILDSSSTSSFEGGYQYDIQVKRDDDSITTVMQGTMQFTQDVTNRTT